MKFNMEKLPKKRKWKNGLSITPFVTQKKDAGDVEKGAENFNAMMTTGSPTGPASSGGMGESLEESKMEKIKEDFKDIYEDQDLDELIGMIQVNAPYSREEEKPEAKECMINEINIPDNMRFKDWDIDLVNDDEIQINWTTQEPFTSEDSEQFIAEIKRFFEALVRREEFHKPFTVALEVMCRSLDEDDGHLVYDLKFNEEELNEENKMEFKHLHESEIIKEDLDNVTEVEDKAREVVDPAFASAAREIRSHDKEREEARKLRKAPKEGEESLPKDLKITLDESLFTEEIDPYIGWQFDDEDPVIGDLDSFIYEIRNARRGAFTNAKTYHDLGMYIKELADRLDGFGDEVLMMKDEEENVEESINEAELITRISKPADQEFTSDMHLRDAYTIYEPEEFQLDRLRNDITLEDIWKAMQDGEDVYEFASVDGEGFDSAVREGIFNMMEIALGIDYDTIYNTWLNN